MRMWTRLNRAAGAGILLIVAGIVYMGTVTASDMAREDTSPGNYSTEISMLKKHLGQNGFDTDALFAHPKFAIDETIGERFKKSAEATGIKAYLDAEESEDPARKEQVFQDELVRYKTRIGYKGKRKGLEAFVRKYGDQLKASEQTYGVPAEVTAAIIGIESNYGAVTGKHYAFNVYVSMYAVGYRPEFALSQLKELLAFARKKDMDVFAVKSSYAGAMGYMQFIPYSLNHWFVGDDLYDMGDTISSVANYLAHFMKKRGSVERAVFSYNPSKFYTRTVLDLAEYAKQKYGEHM